MNLNKQYIDHGAKWGIIQFAAVTITYFMLYFVALRIAVTYGFWIIVPLTTVILVVQGLQARRFNNGALTYGDAFKTMFIAVSLSTVLFFGSSLIVKSYIVPDKAEEEKIVNIENAAKGMEDWGVDEDRIEKTIEKMEERDAKPTLVEALVQTVFFVFIYTLIVLIVAIFVKRKPKEGEIIIEQ